MDTNKIFIDMAQRAHEFAEMCRLMQKIPDMPLTAEVKDALDEYAKRLGLPKADPEAWREEYRKKQAAGVRFEKLWYDGFWHKGECAFTGKKEDYREVPQPIPHEAERALWKAQREAGTNEVWQWKYFDGAWIDIDLEPRWTEKEEYRVKPTKLTARICMVGKAYPMSYIGQDWEFTGTREEYRAECEKYGYAILSEIKEVKPKTVKYYFALMKNSAGEISVEWCDENNLSTLKKMGSGWSGHTIIGDIEEREIEA